MIYGGRTPVAAAAAALAELMDRAGEPERAQVGIAPEAEQGQRLAEYARARLEAALSGLAGGVEVDGDVALALMALCKLYGSTEPITLDPNDVMEHMDQREPKCTCPPELVARGGFRSSCPVDGR